MLLNRAGRANPNDVFHAIAVKQFVGVNADGGHNHTGSHNRYFHTFIIAGITMYAPDIIHQHRVFQKVFRDKFRAQRIPGH